MRLHVAKHGPSENGAHGERHERFVGLGSVHGRNGDCKRKRKNGKKGFSNKRTSFQ